MVARTSIFDLIANVSRLVSVVHLREIDERFYADDGLQSRTCSRCAQPRFADVVAWAGGYDDARNMGIRKSAAKKSDRSLSSTGNDGRGCGEHDESAGQNGGFERSSGGVGCFSSEVPSSSSINFCGTSKLNSIACAIMRVFRVAHLAWFVADGGNSVL